MTIAIDQLPRGRRAHVTTIDWAGLRPEEARRLRELGFDEGVLIEKLHHGPVARDPIAFRVGRMTVAIRKKCAAVIRAHPEEKL